jgi:hypothetical protein
MSRLTYLQQHRPPQAGKAQRGHLLLILRACLASIGTFTTVGK